MEKGRKKWGRNSIVRIVLVGISIVVQLMWFVLRMQWLNDYYQHISIVTDIMVVVVLLRLNYKNVNPSMKIPWIMLIMAFPVMGLCMYGLFHLLGDPGVGKRLRKVQQELRPMLQSGAAQVSECRYVANVAGYPAWGNTQVRYHGEATEAFEDLKADLLTAECFIFMEYFIVEDASAFHEIEQILAQKAAQGVQVRLMYDDIGSIGTSNMRYAARLNKKGIRCMPFNPAVPLVNLFMNHRDHRKITVIDGKVAYTGGYNLAEEYFGRTQLYGHWKDTGLRLEGEAVRGLTAIFLELWSVQTREQEDFEKYLNISHAVAASGIVQPFGDNPLGEERIAENVYLSLIHSARQRLYIITPYLIITDEMTHALTMAVQRGVDVRIITPGIPDKKIIYQITRSYYGALANKGIRIYEYTPGFCHAKMCVCDDRAATVGTSNLDYRSLYHHFENNVLLVDVPAIADILEDFEAMFAQSREVTQHYRKKCGLLLRFWRYILRLFAPLL